MQSEYCIVHQLQACLDVSRLSNECNVARLGFFCLKNTTLHRLRRRKRLLSHRCHAHAGCSMAHAHRQAETAAAAEPWTLRRAFDRRDI